MDNAVLVQHTIDNHADDIHRVDNELVADIFQAGFPDHQIAALVQSGDAQVILGMLKIAYFMGYRHFFDG